MCNFCGRQVPVKWYEISATEYSPLYGKVMASPYALDQYKLCEDCRFSIVPDMLSNMDTLAKGQYISSISAMKGCEFCDKEMDDRLEALYDANDLCYKCTYYITEKVIDNVSNALHSEAKGIVGYDNLLDQLQMCYGLIRNYDNVMNHP